MARVLASCSDVIKFWDIPTTSPSPSITPTKVFNPHSSTVTCLSWSGHNQVLVSGSSDGSLSVSLRGAQVLSLEGNGMVGVNGVVVSGSSRLLAAADDGGRVHVWDLKSRNLLKSFPVSLSQETSATCVQFNASDSHIAAGGSGGDIVLYSMTTNQTVANFQVPNDHDSGVRDLKYSPFSRHILAACSDDGGVHMWDTHSRRLHGTFPHQHGAPASSLVFSPVSRLLLVSCGLDKKIIFYDVEQKKIPKLITTDSPLSCLSFMDDGITLAAGTTQGKIFVYDLRQDSTPIHTLKAHEPMPVHAIQFQHQKSASALASGTPTRREASPAIPLSAPTSSTSTSSSSSIPPSTPASLPRPSIPDIAMSETPIKPPMSGIPSHMSEVAAFSPIKTGKGSSAHPPTLSRDDHHREVILKAQRALKQPVPTLSSTLSSRSLQALQQADEASKSGSKANGLHSSSDNLIAKKPLISSSSSSALPSTSVPLTSTPTVVSTSAPTSPSSESPVTSPNLNGTSRPKQASPEPSAVPLPSSQYASFTPSDMDISPSLSSTPTVVPTENAPSPTSPSTPRLDYTPPTSPPATSHLKSTNATSTSLVASPMVRHTFQQPPASTTPPASPPHHPPSSYMPTSSSYIPSSSSPPPIMPIHDVQRQLIQSVLADSLDDFKGAIRQDVQNLHLELIRQFQLQQLEMREMLEHYVQNSQRELIEEIKALRQENALLRQRVFY